MMADIYSTEHIPVPLISSGNTLEKDEGVSSRVKSGIPLEVPSAVFMDTMSIGSSRFRVLWRPNNYRRKSRLKFTSLDTGYPVSDKFSHARRSKKGVWSIRDYDRITILLGPRVVTAMWSQRVINGEKELFLLESNREIEVLERIAGKREEIRILLDRALVDLAERLGMKIEEPVWDRFEDYVRDERIDELVAKLPRGCIVYDSFFKKVYDEGVEFVQSTPGEFPGARLSSYLKNRAFEDVAPEVAAELAAIRRDVANRFLMLTRSIERLEKAPNGSLRLASVVEQKRLTKWSEVSNGRE